MPLDAVRKLGALVLPATCMLTLISHAYGAAGGSKGTTLIDAADQRNGLVDFKENPRAPEPPGIGIAIRLDQPGNPARFGLGKPVILHGAYRADMDLIRLCREGLPESILITILRVDKPWGETTNLFIPKTILPKPQMPVDAPYDPSFRVKGQFKVDLRLFFHLPAETSRYRVDVSLGPYHSEKLDLEIRP